MPDNDLTNLPILDDIVVPGDTGKAAPDTSSKIPHSSWPENKRVSDDSKQAAKHAVIGPDECDEDAAESTESLIEDRPDHDTMIRLGVTLPGSKCPEATPADTAESANPVSAPGHVPTPDNAQTIERMTEEVLAEMMPKLEQLIRDKIRRVLTQHLPGNNDPD